MKNKFVQELVHAAVSVVLFGIPLFVVAFPKADALTVGGVLTLVYNYLVRVKE